MDFSDFVLHLCGFSVKKAVPPTLLDFSEKSRAGSIPPETFCSEIDWTRQLMVAPPGFSQRPVATASRFDPSSCQTAAPRQGFRLSQATGWKVFIKQADLLARRYLPDPAICQSLVSRHERVLVRRTKGD